MSGPLPNERSRRRNTPTIPTTSLPASGRKGRPPAVPDGYDLGEAGQRWWKWAWATPQAVSWDAGSRYTVARRAQLEDDLAALGSFDPHALNWLFAGLDPECPETFDQALEQLGRVIGRLKALAGGELPVMKEMRELDMQLGLGPKALAGLRWKIVADEEPAKTTPTPTPTRPKGKSTGKVRRLRAVDPIAATG